MTPSQISSMVRLCRAKRRPLFIWGPPGVGKSDLVATAAKDENIALIDFRMALRDPTDLKGIPWPDQKTGTTKYFRDGELPKDGNGMLFMDELNSAAPATQAAGMQLALYPHRIGDYQLPEGWSIVAAGNRENDRGVVHRMPSPLANRFTHCEYNIAIDDWVHWAQDNSIAPELIAFLRFKPDVLFTFDPKSASHAFATPRSWVAAEELRAAAPDSKIAFEALRGTVGDGPAGEYTAFLKLIAELPSVDEIKLNPDTVPIPKEPATQYAICTALSSATTKTGFSRFMEYIKRMPTEFQAVYIRDSMRKVPELKTDKVFVNWAIKNENVLM